MAESRVAEQLRKVTTALEAAGVLYAVIGGNAVAAWVGSVDENAVRATKDVDILLRRSDLPRAADATRTCGMMLDEVLGVPMLLEAAHPTPKTAVHIIVANERVYPDDLLPAPDPDAGYASPAGFRVIGLLELLVMKLQAYRFHDRGHVADLLTLGLLKPEMRDRLPEPLRERFDEIIADMRKRPGYGGR